MSEDVKYTKLHKILRGEENVLDLTTGKETDNERFCSIQCSILQSPELSDALRNSGDEVGCSSISE